MSARAFWGRRVTHSLQASTRTGIFDTNHAAELLGDEVARNSQMHHGYGGHVLTFPTEHSKTMNAVAFPTKKDGRWEDDRWVLPINK